MHAMITNSIENNDNERHRLKTMKKKETSKMYIGRNEETKCKNKNKKNKTLPTTCM